MAFADDVSRCPSLLKINMNSETGNDTSSVLSGVQQSLSEVFTSEIDLGKLESLEPLSKPVGSLNVVCLTEMKKFRRSDANLNSRGKRTPNSTRH